MKSRKLKITKKQTLLEKAKDRKRRYTTQTRRYNKEEIELALAWVDDEIGLSDIGTALELKGGSNAYSFLAFVLKQFINDMKN